MTDDILRLKELQLDALREVANIGAGHAATALSEMTDRRIMISVPKIMVTRLEESAESIGGLREVVVAVLIHMMGDLTGRTLLLFPEENAKVLCDLLLHREPGTTQTLGELEKSSIKETGNIVGSAYMNALSDFMGMMLVPSVPGLAIDMISAIVTSTYLNFGTERDYVICVETRFRVDESGPDLRGQFLLLPDVASLKAILDAVRLT